MASSVTPRRLQRAGLALGVLLALLAFPSVSRSSDADTDDGGATAALDGIDGGGPELDQRAAQIRLLIAGTLPLSVDPQSLFEVPLGDDVAQQVERVRLEALLDAEADKDDAGTAPQPKHSAKPASSGSDLARSPDAHLQSTRQWQAREQLDRARLAYYALPKQQRDELLKAQEARVTAAQPKETDNERRSREAEAERRRALAAAQTARSEAERLVSKEVARLIGVESDVTMRQQQFKQTRIALAARKDSLLGWQKRVADAKSTTAAADETYDAVRRTLRVSRDELDAALNELDSDESAVPDIGPNPLTEISSTVPTEAARVRRKTVEAEVVAARREERAVRALTASTLLTEINTLNSDRLSLLGSLSEGKRAGITGFTQAGFDQSQSEARQLLLILRYHRYIAQGWLGDLRRRQGIRGVSAWDVAVVALPWLLVIIGFVWLKRRSPGWLAGFDDRLAKAERREQQTAPGLLRRALHFLMGFYRTLEWLAFFSLTVWLLPASAKNLLEVQMVEVIVGWTLGGALIVNVINAIAASSFGSDRRGAHDIGVLRLRSLRLVGRTIVIFVLVLVVSSRLVGKGTVYSWVYSTCWLAAIPVFLLLVRWWRDVVFQRVERVRRKSELQTWILVNRTGWKSFFAAMVAAVQLFVVGVYKTLRNWITSFNLARRAHAYLFKRELARLASDQPVKQALPLNSAALARLAPTSPTVGWVPCASDGSIDELVERASNGKGGVIALVGGRGMGKSSILNRLAACIDGTAVFDCRGAVERGLSVFLDATAGADSEGPALVLLDDAQAFVRPVRGGLRVFDEALAFARNRSHRTLWVFAIDSVVWPFLTRARDSRPLFDDVVMLRAWTDEQIGALLALRSSEAEITPTFEDLLEKLPAAADEVDKQEALAARRVGYFRMVWDYARGNPAMALEVWRASLSEDAAGLARVRSLAVPDDGRLESLPDSALFILRAIMQLEPATVSEIAKSTRLAESQIVNAVQFGLHHGYLSEEGSAIRIAWAWLRAVIVLLERRHLLVNT